MPPPRVREDFVAQFDMSTVPVEPGCYIMEDAKGKPIYVGKAKSLRARIRTYINASDSRYSVKFLMRRVSRIQFLVTANEKEALLLENSPIKQHRPRYNVQLKDDKTYISLRVDTREDFPRITVVRRYQKDGARYFGPYHSAASVRNTLRRLQDPFRMADLLRPRHEQPRAPLPHYQMKQCAAPCVGYVTREAYHEIVDQVLLILEGKSAVLEDQLLAQICSVWRPETGV